MREQLQFDYAAAKSTSLIVFPKIQMHFLQRSFVYGQALLCIWMLYIHYRHRTSPERLVDTPAKLASVGLWSCASHARLDSPCKPIGMTLWCWHSRRGGPGEGRFCQPLSWDTPGKQSWPVQA